MADSLLHSGKFIDVDDNEITVSFYKRPNIYAEPSSLHFDEERGTLTLAIWSYNNSVYLTDYGLEEWLSFTQVSSERLPGSQYYKYTYEVTCSSNPGYDRETTLRVGIDDGPDIGTDLPVVVKQDGELGPQSDLEVSPMNITYNRDGGTNGVVCTWTVGGEPRFTMVYVEGGGGWLTQVGFQEEEDSDGFSIDIAWTASPNTTGSSRTARLNIANDVEVKVVSISQPAIIPSDIDVSPDPLEYPATYPGALISGYIYKTFTITWRDEDPSYMKEPTYSIEYVTGEPGWLRFEGQPGHYNGTYESSLTQSMRAEDNNTGSTRTAHINIYRKADYSDPDSPDVFKYALNVIQPSN